MPEDPGIQMLLESILSTQREAANEMRRLTNTMATKDDISGLTRAMEDTIVRREYDEHRKSASERADALETRIKTLEDVRLPKWFWPALTCVLTIISPILTAIIIHWH